MDFANPAKIFNTSSGFNELALEIFYFQAQKNKVYKNFLKQINVRPEKIKTIAQIPFLPIEFFKTHKVITNNRQQTTNNKQLFISSGTTGQTPSKHYVSDISVYEKSFTKCFELFYGNIQQYCLLALLPSYRENSSLIYMIDSLIKKTENKYSGFYMNNYEELAEKLLLLKKKRQKTILIGVSFALIHFTERNFFPFPIGEGWDGALILMETGGMKGRKEEMPRQELHEILCQKSGVKKIHSEYGMTELLSQAYSKGNGIFHCPPWIKIYIRDVNDYFQILKNGQTGGINIIDLANINSCSFIATQDLGRKHSDGSFEVLGRFDNSELRGCNLMVA